MPIQDLPSPRKLSALAANVLGLQVSGDLGPFTIYTDRHGVKVIYPKSPPKEPPSPAQAWQRARFQRAQQDYMALTDETKRAWETLAYHASLCMTGQNLYISIVLKNDYTGLATLIAQTGVFVPDPPEV